MSSEKDVEKQFRKLGTYQKPWQKKIDIERVRKSLLRKIKAQIKDEEKASKTYFDLQTEARLIDQEVAGDLYKISGEEFTHKTKLEEIVRKLGGKV